MFIAFTFGWCRCAAASLFGHRSFRGDMLLLAGNVTLLAAALAHPRTRTHALKPLTYTFSIVTSVQHGTIAVRSITHSIRLQVFHDHYECEARSSGAFVD